MYHECDAFVMRLGCNVLEWLSNKSLDRVWRMAWSWKVLMNGLLILVLSSSFFALHVSNPLSLKGEGVTLRLMLRSVTVIVTP